MSVQEPHRGTATAARVDVKTPLRLGSGVGQHVADASEIGLVHHPAQVQLALALAGLLGEDVTLMGAAALEGATAGLLEALGSAPVGLDLGHLALLLNLLYH